MRASLLQKGLDLDERDFFQVRFSEEELRHLLGNRSPSDVFSWNSPSFKKLGKKLGLNREDMDDGQLIRLMVEEPRFIRRPLIQVGNVLVVGTDKRAMEQAFP